MLLYSDSIFAKIKQHTAGKNEWLIAVKLLLEHKYATTTQQPYLHVCFTLRRLGAGIWTQQPHLAYFEAAAIWDFDTTYEVFFI